MVQVVQGLPARPRAGSRKNDATSGKGEMRMIERNSLQPACGFHAGYREIDHGDQQEKQEPRAEYEARTSLRFGTPATSRMYRPASGKSTSVPVPTIQCARAQLNFMVGDYSESRLFVACASSFVMLLALPGQTKADAITITPNLRFTLSRDPVAAYPQGCPST